jgi:Zn2+/Cd2+-exporting ATPase
MNQSLEIGYQAGAARAVPSAADAPRSAPATRAPAPQREQGEEGLYERYHLAVATALTGVFLALGWGLGALGLIDARAQVALYLLAYLTGGTYAAAGALHALFVERTIDVDLLMVGAAIGAAVIGHWPEGGILLFLFSLGNTLEHYAMGRTYRAIRALMKLSPEDALLVRDGAGSREERVPVAALRLDDVVLVKPGERVPVDGVVLSGTSAVDQAAITGESVPVGKAAGDGVFAGTINGHGALRVRVTRLAEESTLAKIIKIVEEARAQKSAAQRFTDAFEGRYAGGIILLATLVAVVPWLLFDQPFAAMFYRAMVLLVVASPCALVISTPASTLSALANAARQGILFKGAVHLENAGVVRAVAFDKTGTLTLGRPRLTDVVALPGVDEAELLTRAASVERLSEHPLAQAVVGGAHERGLALRDAGDLRAITGRGVRATLGRETLLIGNEALFAAEGLAIPPAASEAAARLREDGKTAMYIGALGACGRQGGVLGVLAVADTVRPVAREVVAALKRLGVARTVMLTGDNERAARAIARQAGIDEVRAGLLPEEKVAVVKELLARHGAVAMVGDGVNDAPALATATIGVAMGAAGSDVALETADVVLMADDLAKLPYAIELSRRTRRVIRQNLTFALGVISVLVGFAFFGAVPLPVGVVGHEGSTIVVVANGLRLLRGRASVGVGRRA